MKFSAVIFLTAISAFAMTQSMTQSAAAQTASSKRMKAIEQCIDLAHKMEPPPVSPDDPEQYARRNVYMNCMRKAGQRP